jgi:hypothetical protein
LWKVSIIKIKPKIMGDIADMLIDGTLDFYTGEYIGKGKGYPRTFDRSLPWEGKDFTQSKKLAFKGVSKYLRHRLKITDITPVVNLYLPTNEKSLKQKCLQIQKDFGSFVKWVHENEKTLKTKK